MSAAEATGWLASLLGETAAARPEGDDGWHAPLSHATRDRKPIYVVSHGASVSGGHRGLTVWRDKKLEAQLDWDRVGELVLIGGRQISSHVLQECMRRRIPVAFHAANGEPQGFLLPERVRAVSPVALAQAMWLSVPGQALAAARSLVEAKIHNTRLLARRQPGEDSQLMAQLDEGRKAALRANSVDRLRGIEGRAAHDWFGRWPKWVAGRFDFPGRSGRGAKDPLNAVLNLLYSQLYRQCWLAALMAGLDPTRGVLHDGHGRYAALAADLQEPFRFLCDRMVLDFVRRNRLNHEDFRWSENATVPVRMTDSALKLVLGEWEHRLDAEVQVGDRKASYRTHIEEQAKRLADVVTGRRADVDAFRLKW